MRAFPEQFAAISANEVLIQPAEGFWRDALLQGFLFLANQAAETVVAQENGILVGGLSNVRPRRGRNERLLDPIEGFRDRHAFIVDQPLRFFAEPTDFRINRFVTHFSKPLSEAQSITF